MAAKKVLSKLDIHLLRIHLNKKGKPTLYSAIIAKYCKLEEGTKEGNLPFHNLA